MATGLLVQVDESNLLYSKLSRMGNYGWGEYGANMDVSQSGDKQHDDLFGIDPFYIKKGNEYELYGYLI
jgi:midasin